MKLLTFAHKGEAREFIKRKHTIPVEFYFDGVFRDAEEILLITGEGIQSTTERLTAVCTYFGQKIDSVLNLGIAGSLVNDLQINQLYGVHNIHIETLYPDNTKVFTTTDQNSKYNCISSLYPVLNDSYARRLADIAEMVDRELWACGSVCKLFKLPLKSYKLISDRAGSDSSPQKIKSRTDEFSKHLFDFYKKLDLNQRK